MTNGYTDFHNHLIPGVDDGARDAEFSAGALAAFRRNGVRQLVVTPHFDGSLTQAPERMAARLAELDSGWDVLRGVVDADAEEFGSAMQISRGVELMLDVPDPDLADERLRLAGTNFVLVEYPGLQLPPLNAGVAIGLIRRAGWQPIIAHPERYRNATSVASLAELSRAGAYFQLNAGSILGHYGSTAQALATDLLSHGAVSYVCSDYHARGEPATGMFARTLADAGFSEQVELLLDTNPARLLRGEPPLPVPAIAVRPSATSWWRRLTGQ